MADGRAGRRQVPVQGSSPENTPGGPMPAGRQRADPNTAMVYLDPDTHERLKRYIEDEMRRIRRGRPRGAVASPRPTFTTVTLRAIEEMQPLLAGLFAAPEVESAGLFTLPVRTAAGRRQLTGPQASVRLQPGEANVGVLDKLAEDHGVNRSEFVDTVLQAWLPALPARRTPRGRA
jgi:hypothetical protein